MASNPSSKITEQQYLTIERAAEFKSEFVDGVMHAMSGGTLRHSALQRNLLSQLDAMLRGSECQVFTADLRVGVSARMCAYPDVLVDQDQPRVEQYIRQDETTWTMRDHTNLDQELKMDSISVSLPLRRIYDGVDLES